VSVWATAVELGIWYSTSSRLSLTELTLEKTDLLSNSIHPHSIPGRGNRDQVAIAEDCRLASRRSQVVGAAPTIRPSHYRT
jgi:hypothetical protein